MTPRQDLLDHAVDLFPAPEGSVADVQRDVARRHRNRRLGAAAVVVGIWVIFGVAACALRSQEGRRPAETPPVATPSPTLESVGGLTIHGWPDAGRNQAGTYSWKPTDVGWMHNATGQGSGHIAIVVDAVPGHLAPHEGTSVTVFGYQGSYQRYTGALPAVAPGASCEQWMVDIQGTTVTIKVCAEPEAPAEEVVEAHDIVESIRVEPSGRLVFTLTTSTWDSG